MWYLSAWSDLAQETPAMIKAHSSSAQEKPTVEDRWAAEPCRPESATTGPQSNQCFSKIWVWLSFVNHVPWPNLNHWKSMFKQVRNRCIQLAHKPGAGVAVKLLVKLHSLFFSFKGFAHKQKNSNCETISIKIKWKLKSNQWLKYCSMLANMLRSHDQANAIYFMYPSITGHVHLWNKLIMADNSCSPHVAACYEIKNLSTQHN